MQEVLSFLCKGTASGKKEGITWKQSGKVLSQFVITVKLSINYKDLSNMEIHIQFICFMIILHTFGEMR